MTDVSRWSGRPERDLRVRTPDLTAMALLAAEVPTELLVLPGADHGSQHFDQSDVHETTLRFLRVARITS